MTVRFFSKSPTHSEFSNFAPFGIDLDDARWGVGREGAAQNRLGTIMERIRAELRNAPGC